MQSGQFDGSDRDHFFQAVNTSTVGSIFTAPFVVKQACRNVPARADKEVNREAVPGGLHPAPRHSSNARDGIA